tara:strand:+ start:28 stop:666 length:639 start_codon:yes stop_codon:yes gene_type:complete
MSKLIISIFENKVFLEILNEIKLFKDLQIEFVENYDENIINKINRESIIIFFLNEKNIDYFSKFKSKGFSVLLVNNNLKDIKQLKNFSEERINAPFKILDFKNKINSIFSKQKFKESSFIQVGGYKIDKNERKIEKDKKVLKLTEKEINLLIFFASNKNSIKKEFILENLWHYSKESDTHTVETHIHRLRKKILKKFRDANFIKNNEQGYYI